MAKRVKTDLFEGLMKAPEKKAAPAKAEEKKAAPKPAQKPAPVKAEPEKTEPVETTPVPETKNLSDLAKFLKKAQAPSSKSHTFYLKDTVYEKLVQSAKDNGTTPSKLLEALIQMNL